MSQNILDTQLKNYRTQISEIVKDLHDLTIKIGHDELAQTVSDLRNRINEPFMFVIVGEVKAGKSSFINALLATGREITKVAPQPMTDTVQQITYGEQEEVINVNPYLKKILQPVEILKEIAIVDTPGTNTIVDHHQEITERFIPASDLIVFVFEAKNPYRQSAWEFFDFIHTDWRKKIIFVLQQKDLMPIHDLNTNVLGVQEYAEKKGIMQPTIFAVSAKQEQEGDLEESGFIEVRNYIRDNITGGKAPKLKLQNNIATGLNVNERILSGVQLRKQQWEADVNFRKETIETLDVQEVKSNKQVEVLVENLVAGYERITRQKERELEAELSFVQLLKRSFSSIFVKTESSKDRLEKLTLDLEKDLNLELQTKLNNGVADLADSIQQMAKIIDLKIQNSQTILKNNHAIFSDIADRRAAVMTELQEAFKKFLSRTENFRDDSLFDDKEALSPNLLAGSGIAVVGAIIMTVAQGAAFDITGGILTTIGVLFAGVSTSMKRRNILKGYRNEVEKGRNRLKNELTEKLKLYVQHIKERIDANFKPFDSLLEEEEKAISSLEEKQSAIETSLKKIGTEIESL